MWTYQVKTVLTLLPDYQEVYINLYDTIKFWSTEGKTLNPDDPSTHPVPIRVGPDSLFQVIRPWDTEQSALQYIEMVINARKAHNDRGIDMYLYLYPLEENPSPVAHFEYH
jgi:hypothetical protein